MLAISEDDAKIFEAIIETKSLQKAADRLGMPGGTLRSWLFRKNLIFAEVERFYNEWQSLRRRLGRKKRFFG